MLACVGDLPALRAESLRRMLAAAPAPGRVYLADRSGVGTTMLLAHGVALRPHFQQRSARAHAASGAVALLPDEPEAPGLDARTDVDTEDDLYLAAGLGLGPATAALIDPESGRLGRYGVITVTDHRDAALSGLAVSAAGRRLRLPLASLDAGWRHVRTGQRLHAVVAGGTVISAWL